MKYIVIFLFATSLFAENIEGPETISSLVSGHISLSIDGLICPINGTLTLSELDAEAPSLCPITIDRFYSSGSNWAEANHGRLDLHFEESDHINKYTLYSATVWGPYGQPIQFKSFPKGRRSQFIFAYEPKVFELGQTNLTGSEISGRTNPKNCHLFEEPNISSLVMSTGSGLKLYFGEAFKVRDSRFIDKKINPNGSYVTYNYDHKHRLAAVDAFTRSGKLVTTARYSYQNNWTTIHLSNGSNVVYENAGMDKIVRVLPSDGPQTWYEYDKIGRLLKKKKPEGRDMHISYQIPGRSHHEEHIDHMRVETISVPSNLDGSMAKILSMNYCVNKKARIFIAKSSDSAGHWREYHVLKGKVVHITHRNHDNSVDYTKTDFHWNEPNDVCPNALRSIVFRGPANEIHFVRQYNYDDRGNPISEQLFGNLSGKYKQGLVINESGYVASHDPEVYQVQKSYFPEKNLLKSEDDGVKGRYLFYHEDTDQISKELIHSEGVIRERHFFLYNEDLSLIKEVIDDGSSQELDDLSGVTERRIVHKKYNGPHSGLVTEEKYCCLDLISGHEVLTSRNEKDYNQRGRLVKERTFDADDVFQFEHAWDYDGHGNVNKEVGPLGEEVKRIYDDNNNLVYETGPNFENEKHFVYDKMNRRIKETEILGGDSYTTSYAFDVLSRKRWVEDRYGYLKNYDYDSMSRLNFIQEGKDRTFTKTYHPTGYVKTLTDPSGGETSFEYTIRGKPYYTHYPDGTEEYWEYDNLGNLVKHTDSAGQTLQYAYDYKGRVVSKKYFDRDQNFLFDESWVYNTFHLLSDTDKSGNTTTYDYNFKGQLIRQNKRGLETLFFYNPQGLLAIKVTANELVERYYYDLIGRLVSETKEDIEGNILLFSEKVYDFLGRVISETKGDYTTRYIYNSKDEIIQKILPDGRSIHFSHNHKHINAKGETVLLKKEFDTKGRVLEQEFDTARREVRSARYDAFGNLLQQTFKTYNSLNMVESSREEIYYQGEKERDYVITFTYDPLGRPKEITEEKGAFHERSTFFEYDQLGQKIKTVKPNGTVIHYSYDSRGRVSEEISTDGSINYTIQYDLFSRPIEAKNKLHGRASLYEYDNQGHIIRETLGTGETVLNYYDLRGRLVEVKHGRTDSVKYRHDGLYLREVDWKDLKAKYESYDLSGNLLKGLGIDYSYDTACRLTGWKKGDYCESIVYNDVGNLIQRSLLGFDTHYDYDELNQLEKESGTYEKSYSHDSHYNRRKKNGKDYAIDPLNQPTAYGDASFTWDRNGNLIEKSDASGQTQYFYDARDRLIALKKEGQLVAEYLWDEQNRCIKAGSTTFLYQGRAEVGSVKEETLESFRVMGLGRGQETGATLWAEIQGEIYSPLHDLSGNLIALTDQEDKLLEHNPLSAFGEKIDEKPSLSPWDFCSKRREDHSGLILFGYRFYDPTLGRFITADPAGFDAGPNLWAYCNNNPLTFTDLFGLSPIAYLNSERESNHDDKSSHSKQDLESNKTTNQDPHYGPTGDHDVSSVKSTAVNSATGVETLSSREKVQYAKERLIDLNRRYRQGIYSGFNPIRNSNKSEWVCYGDNLTNPKVVLVGACGIQTNIEEATARAKACSGLIGGDACFWYDPYNTEINDELFMAGIEKMGMKTEEQSHFKDGVEIICEVFGSDANLVMPAFSRGNLLIKNSAQQWKDEGKNYHDQIVLRSLASPALIGDKACKEVSMHSSENDGVCYLMGIARWNPPEHLQIHKSNTRAPFDHAFDGEVYRNVYQTEVINVYLKMVN